MSSLSLVAQCAYAAAISSTDMEATWGKLALLPLGLKIAEASLMQSNPRKLINQTVRLQAVNPLPPSDAVRKQNHSF